MYITAIKLDDVTVFVRAYDFAEDPERELCAVFLAIPEEEKVQLIAKHWRRLDDPEKCLLDFDDELRARMNSVLPKMYDRAMAVCRFTPFDDSLPATQEKFPF